MAVQLYTAALFYTDLDAPNVSGRDACHAAMVDIFLANTWDITEDRLIEWSRDVVAEFPGASYQDAPAGAPGFILKAFWRGTEAVDENGREAWRDDQDAAQATSDEASFGVAANARTL